MNDFGDTLVPITDDFLQQGNGGYHEPVLLRETVGARLYRVKKAGKFFIIKTPIDNSGMRLELLKREYTISIGMSHPNIIGVFTFENNTPVGPGMVMEYIDGRAVDDWLKENPKPAERRRVFMQILDAVNYVHKQSVIHNDIKPSNILITRLNNDVRLIDFGVSDDDANYLLQRLGCTSQYASPELLRREADIDVRSDIYSIGIIMQEIFGKKYSSIVKKCLNENLEKRYPGIEELRAAFTNHINRWKKTTIALASVAILSAILIPTSFYIREYRMYENLLSKDVEAENLRKHYVTKGDSLLEMSYRQSADSINNHPYTQRLRDVPQNFVVLTTPLLKKIATEITDEKVRTLYLDHVEKQQYVMQNELENLLTARIDKTKSDYLAIYKKTTDKEYQLTRDSISKTPYMEFASRYLSNYANKIGSLNNFSNTKIDDEEIVSYLVVAQPQYSNKYFETLVDMHNNKKLLAKTDLPIDEEIFYSKLLYAKKPYRPYKKK